jgi:hypothetical protein
MTAQPEPVQSLAGSALLRIQSVIAFFVFVRVISFRMEPPQLHDFVDGAGDRRRADLLARVFSAVHFASMCHESIRLSAAFTRVPIKYRRSCRKLW